MRIIGLLLVTIIAIGLAATAQAAPGVPWPSLSPSYRCDNGMSVFVLTNVGIDMQQGSPWQVRTPKRVVASGIFWIAAGRSMEWWYNAPNIPLTLSYRRPDNGQTVELTQTCEGYVEAEQAHQWYFPLVADMANPIHGGLP